MWYDPDPKKPASVKIDEAARRYYEKFGAEPNACHVSPEAAVSHAQVHVVPNRWIRPHYFWLGVDDQFAPVRRHATHLSPVARPRPATRDTEPAKPVRPPARRARREALGKSA